MHDWRKYVCARLNLDGAYCVRKEEIVEEIAIHLGQIEKDSLSNRETEEQLMKRIEAAVGNWNEIEHSIRNAYATEGFDMKLHAYTIWIPGVLTCMMILAVDNVFTFVMRNIIPKLH